MKSKALGLLAAALMGGSGAAGAAATLSGSTTNPTGINGVVVDGTTYDVAFSITTLDTTFTFGTMQSTDAAGALAAALNTLSVVALGGESSEDDGFYLDVDDNLTPSFDAPYCFSSSRQCSAGSWSHTDIGEFMLGQNSAAGQPIAYLEAADFTPAPVPVPASIWLIVSGLAALGLTGRRRGQTAAV